MTDAALQPDVPPLIHPIVPPAAAVPPPAPGILPLSFTGKAGEYFRIWIVNLFLSIATLGIYSAWAKVRKKRYFYGNTWLDGANFEYHGDPRAILRGRLVAVLLFLAYTLVGGFSARAAAGLLLAAAPLVPWLLLRSWRFNAANSSYRHLRFGFHGRYGKTLASLAPLFLFPAVTLLMGEIDSNPHEPTALEMVQMFVPLLLFGLFYPWMSGRLHLIRANGSRYGTTPFDCSARVGEFYGIYILAGLIGTAAAIAVFAPLGFLAAFRVQAWALIPMMALGYVALVSLSLGYTQSRISNLLLGSTRLGEGVRLRSRLSARKLGWTYATNMVAILCTAGFAIPWAAVRTARVRAEATQVEAQAGLESFAASTMAAGTAMGDEVGEMFDFDVAL